MNPQTLETDRVAVGCLHLLMGRAVLDFPTSTQSRPSNLVVVSLGMGGPLLSDWRPLFPFMVPWDLWHYIVVPVLNDLRTGGSLQAQQLQDSDYPRRVAQIRTMLVERLKGSVQGS